MADNTTSAFEEVLTIQAALKPFVDSLEAIKTAYTTFINNLGSDAEGVVGAGTIAAVQQEAASMREAFASVLEAFQTVSSGIEELLGRQDATSEAAAQKQVE